MVSANREMAVYCFDTLVAHYNSDESPPPPAFQDAHHVNFDSLLLLLVIACGYNLTQSKKDYALRSCPLFVTWKKVVNGGEPRLRGCIGTLEARDLINGFRDYALTSALRDRRFSPIQSKELPLLECTVSVLSDYETANNYLDWEVGKHGIIIVFTDPEHNTRRNATYLPEVAAHEGWTELEAINSLIRKSGYTGTITESLRKSIRLTRYQSTIFTMHYSEYVSYVKETRGSPPAIIAAKAKPGRH
ncbi:hypothetical protein ACFE04_000920 [Oxalis oulophora]